MTDRRVTVRTDHGDGDRAQTIARSLRPDGTAAMDTRTDGATVQTTIDRPTTGGLRTTLDDYLVGLQVAVQCTTDANDNHE
ncbi:KEOPS complex subunit Pcc1 [Halococcoides cellulosivorans]|uniref:KEOPS complex Pcc1-like subunit n=1 Tax=Halococcoides cellulosivorans TaxID=1679096 RepID=A0A2R4X1X1_9EURY|nr:KEOPS complex subunit Pcc1 [Halococcoides cellulosivorans]AWB27797.1 KEOPS complex Pcc1-like subunit [Halococcoides cellulosivorans]